MRALVDSFGVREHDHPKALVLQVVALCTAAAQTNLDPSNLFTDSPALSRCITDRIAQRQGHELGGCKLQRRQSSMSTLVATSMGHSAEGMLRSLELDNQTKCL